VLFFPEQKLSKLQKIHDSYLLKCFCIVSDISIFYVQTFEAEVEVYFTNDQRAVVVPLTALVNSY